MNEYWLEFARVDRSVENEIFLAANDEAAEEYAIERCRHALAWKVLDKAGERLIAWNLNQLTAY
jgi:predicted dinucleotide-binding enzyme